ncbi:unnamed protein product [Calypogeia fissa]
MEFVSCSIILVDPADIRFTQDSINLYFQEPYGHFSIRQAVRGISKETMSADEFPTIRVISYNGYLWSIDNRRLWVFRFARCKSISVRVVSRMHQRLQDVISNPDQLRMMEAVNFFPRVRDKGQKDRGFYRLYPQPSSVKPSSNYGSQGQANCKVPVAVVWSPVISTGQNQAKSRASIVSPQDHARSGSNSPPIPQSSAQGHAKYGNVTASPPTRPITLPEFYEMYGWPKTPSISSQVIEDHAKSGAATSPTVLDRFLRFWTTLWSAARKTVKTWIASSRKFVGQAVNLAGKISSSVASLATKTASVAQKIINAVYSFFHLGN